MSATREEQTVTTVAWRLSAPANWVEVSKVFSLARAELGTNALWDDVVTVHCHDDELWITYDRALCAAGPTDDA